ncbi:unnamed protein product [Lactuca virosa]|uniref:Replication factor A C-terminal domain-containing protein n=1 Tax=Lactuca virosa TaxID=75947 RepID=A0AAU9NR27_9ASTR|nr:unnamed protein product [Lactuca virosa]
MDDGSMEKTEQRNQKNTEVLKIPDRVIMDKGSEKMLMNMVAQDLSIADMDLNVESSINTSQLNTDTIVAKTEDYYLRSPIKNIDDIPDYNEEIGLPIIATVISFDLDEGWYSFYCRDCSKKVSKNDDDSNVEPFNFDGCGGVSDVYGKVRVIIRVQDETGSASFVLFDRHVKDVIHSDCGIENDKLTDQSRTESIIEDRRRCESIVRNEAEIDRRFIVVVILGFIATIFSW